MNGGLFITLYDEKTLALYLKHGVYGFLMAPVLQGQTPNRVHYKALADYACTREGTHIFFFLNRKIVYGGMVRGNKSVASFYLNGVTSPIGSQSNANLFWDESKRYQVGTNLGAPGTFIVNEKIKSQPFILQFTKDETLSSKMISSDELYFELGQFSYPLPSNTIQGMGFCTLTPGETDIALKLLKSSSETFNLSNSENISLGTPQTLFNVSLIKVTAYISEAHFEFSLLADLQPIRHLIGKDDYILCRQVPISPFKPYDMDRADICLYSIQNPIKGGTIPNVIIELKKDRANYQAYN